MRAAPPFPVLKAVLLWLCLWAGAGFAQTAPDFDEWAIAAGRADAAISDNRTTDLALEQLRTQLTDWRAAFQNIQTANGSQIETVRSQIDALGPIPADGTTEPAQIAKRRGELTRALGLLQAPGLEADEAYRHANGLIGDIDRIIRDRQAAALMQASPSPLNPANWPAAFAALSQTVTGLVAEVRAAWATGVPQLVLGPNLPAILAYLTFALILLLRGRRWIERLSRRLAEAASARGRMVYALIVSLGQIFLPLIGVYLLVEALRLTGMVGLRGNTLLEPLPRAGLAIFVARWLAVQMFPKGVAPDALLKLTPERRKEGRFHGSMLGLVLALQLLRTAVLDVRADAEAANAVISFPILVIVGILLFRLGQLLLLHVANDDVPGEATNYRNRLIGLIGRAATLIGAGGPVVAAMGYVAAASAVMFPAATSLGVVALLIVVQRLAADLYALVTGSDDKARDALVPVLVGFVLTVAAAPVFAVVWGARTADLAEIWARFNTGLSLGGARISPMDFIWFLVLFGLLYGLTRLFQGALKSSILPKTSLDQGGQNAIVSGVGYVGIFLAALTAITSAGIDLSSLAIVAGALSVGIGFGLQNIVSNFVSGIILLIERPVSEGDWIEVGGVMGTVRTISVRSTRIETFDRTDVIVPNADLITGMVTNLTRFNLTGRLIVPVSVAYGSDTQLVARLLLEIAGAQPLVVLNPKPVAHFVGLGNDAMQFELRIILRDVNFRLDVQSAINHQIAARFRDAGIVFPFWARNPDALLAIARYGGHLAGDTVQILYPGAFAPETAAADQPETAAMVQTAELPVPMVVPVPPGKRERDK